MNLDHFRHATRILMERHRVVRWMPMARPEQAAYIPEWLRRGRLTKDFTGTTAL